VNGYPSPCGCALLAPTPCASRPCASVTACNVEPSNDFNLVTSDLGQRVNDINLVSSYRMLLLVTLYIAIYRWSI